VFVEVPHDTGLKAVLDLGVPVTWIGRGSNLLVSDRGIRGITARLVGDFEVSDIAPRSDEAPDLAPRVDAGAGLANIVLLTRVARSGFGGLGCLAGVPGTIGGAVRMNAGSLLGEVSDILLGVQVATPGSAPRWIEPGELDLGYRQCRIPEGGVVTRARFGLLDQDVEADRERVQAFITRRKATQPLDQPSCGSVFKNPPGDHAARLIEAVGLKGMQQGGARISPLHANFIVNTGSATAADVLSLIVRARETVLQQLGVCLEPEVHAVGDWNDRALPEGTVRH
jgi:UDP-N-acetylmuramate dehydrogenase